MDLIQDYNVTYLIIEELLSFIMDNLYNSLMKAYKLSIIVVYILLHPTHTTQDKKIKKISFMVYRPKVCKQSCQI